MTVVHEATCHITHRETVHVLTHTHTYCQFFSTGPINKMSCLSAMVLVEIPVAFLTYFYSSVSKLICVLYVGS